MNLDAIARLAPDRQLEAIRLAESLYGGEGLAAFIARVFPHQPPPRHAKPIIRLIERAQRGERMRVCFSMPPRHVKTETVLRSIAWWLSRAPANTHAYFSYNEHQGQSKSRKARAYARMAGVNIKVDSDSVTEWRTSVGGGLLAGGVGSGLTGQGISGALWVDDPFKDRVAADSPIIRERVWEWFNEVGITRLEQASVFCFHTRWHKDDLIGRLEEQGGWIIVNIPAIAEGNDVLGRAVGEALWDRFPLPELEAIRSQIGEFSFAALYQGRPRPRGGTVFRDPHYYDPATFNMTGCRLVLAGDPAASAKTSADYSAAVVLAVRGSKEKTVAHVLRVYRNQVTVPQFGRDLLALQREFGNTAINVEAVGAFKAIAQMLKEVNPALRIHEIHPKGDKFTRAQPVAAAWNEARVLVPSDNPAWLGPFLDEIEKFTGVNDAYDDQVDALAHAWNHVPGRSMFDVV